MLVGYEELGGGFEPIRNGEVVWVNNNERYTSVITKHMEKNHDQYNLTLI